MLGFQIAAICLSLIACILAVIIAKTGSDNGMAYMAWFVVLGAALVMIGMRLYTT